MFDRKQKRWKSDGARSEEYGGHEITSQPSSGIAAFVTLEYDDGRFHASTMMSSRSFSLNCGPKMAELLAMNSAVIDKFLRSNS